MATRNPVRVLPEPVGEATRTSLPAAMCGQAADCGGVGPAGKRRANQLATAGWKHRLGRGVWRGVGRDLGGRGRNLGWLRTWPRAPSYSTRPL